MISLSVDKYYTIAQAVIKKESQISFVPNLYDILISELNKRKVRNGILINLLDDKMKEDVSKLATKVRINDRLLEDFTVELCRWATPKPTIDDALIYHYKEKGDGKKAPGPNDRVDYADRGFVQSVQKGDLLAEYVKPFQGSAGRNFRGIFIPAREPRIEHIPEFTPDSETIDVKEDEKHILYYAKRNGYVRSDNSYLQVSDTLEVDKISFKSTGDVKTGLDKDVKIDIAGGDAGEDNVGPNTKVEAAEVSLAGSIANGASIIAKVVHIGGSTHQTSKIDAEAVDVNIHRGTLNASEAHVQRNENGRIYADHIHVEQMIGGMAVGKIVEIDVLKSNAIIVASQEIRIKELIGGESKSTNRKKSWSSGIKRPQTRSKRRS